MFACNYFSYLGNMFDVRHYEVQSIQLNFGPQHPSAHGVLRMVMELDGEVCLVDTVLYFK